MNSNFIIFLIVLVMKLNDISLQYVCNSSNLEEKNTPKEAH